MIRRERFDRYRGEDVFLYILEGDGVEVGITDFGAAIQFFRVKTAGGVKDIVLGYPSVKARLESGTYCGAVLGRTANRIKNARFHLGGDTYSLSVNDGNSCNHGGKEGFDKRRFTAKGKGECLELSLFSPDGDQGFPGGLMLKTEYELNGASLSVRFSAECDRDTVWAPTCHPYFCLNGEGGADGDVLLKINANEITPADGENVVTGARAKVERTPFDFTSYKSLGEGIAKTGGYDVNYLLCGAPAASVYCKESGIGLNVYTDMQGLQLYTGNFLCGRGKSGEYRPHDGFCLEPQFVPNAVNLEGFRSPVLKAHEKRTHFIRYEISVSEFTPSVIPSLSRNLTLDSSLRSE